MSQAALRRVFRLFACCVPVRGARRSTLCDLQRGTYQFIPNGLYEILTVHRDRTLPEVQAAYGNAFDAEIAEYFAFLEENGFGFWCDEPEAFPDLSLEWEAPERVTNAIIDVGWSSRHDFASLFRQLDALGCKALQLRYFRPCSPAEAGEVLALLARGRARAVDLLVPHAPAWSFEAVEALCAAHPRVASVFVHSAPEASPPRATAGGAAVYYRTARVDSAAHCGEVHPGYFVVNLDTFTEAQAHNSCLNRKLSVDEHGEIRNCPALPRSFGNAARVSLAAALSSDEFQALWRVAKDQVEVCRDCEFRYVCTDCRAFVRDPANPLSKPAKCTYDPYAARWADAPQGDAAPLASAR